jgi:recombination protein RecA
MEVEGKGRALETTLAQIKKRFGEGSIMKLGDSTSMQVDSIPT